MALLRRRLTRDELREAWNERSARMSNEQLVINFGEPPYWFLGQNTGGNPAPTHAQFHGLMVDGRQREYAPIGPSDPQAAFVRLPRTITAAQNTMAGLMATPMGERMDFPRVGETLVLTGMGTEDDPDRTWRRTVAQVDTWAGMTGQRVATARLVFTQPLPERREIETPAQTRSRDSALERAQTPRVAMLRPAVPPPRHRGFSAQSSSVTTGTSSAAGSSSASKRTSLSSAPPTKRPAY